MTIIDILNNYFEPQTDKVSSFIDKDDLNPIYDALIVIIDYLITAAATIKKQHNGTKNRDFEAVNNTYYTHSAESILVNIGGSTKTLVNLADAISYIEGKI